jgi:phosphopantetheinyl transferase (holo-ACP synthase)
VILGTGIDIIEVERVESAFERFGDRFLNGFCFHPNWPIA